MEEKLVLEPDASKEDIVNAKYIWDLEKEALALWFNGHTSGYNNLWSRKSFSYFDGVVEKRIDCHEDIEKVLHNRRKIVCARGISLGESKSADIWRHCHFDFPDLCKYYPH